MAETGQRGGPGLTASGPAVRATDLRVVRGGRRGTLALDGVSLTVPTGALVGVLGPSGSGKSTLLRAVVGVQMITSGSIEVLGRPAGSADLRRRLGYVTQAPSVYGDLTVVRNLRYLGAVVGAPASDVSRVLAEVDLVDCADRRVDTLSGGQRSRVSLAAALLGTPELLVLDEPTVGLDPVLRRDLWDLFGRLRERGTTLLVSSHVMDEATRCDRLLLLRDGRVIADDTLPGLLARTGTSDADAAFLALVEDEPAAGRGGAR
ncbi:ABC transporter ATP-binding protein [Cellulomonas cellasea]|uniref:ABC transporter ATP-binding protein n=1 Tax=Cellulomonas cellasea TaxID=43670 RepID=UPI0025A402DB|nr:ABC transporter ATP-binding protein [Cellulomonas cellasea]MDM8085583.1 ABC transporter ATP-binding protein [Cellulomonas cellasea]